MTPRSTHRAYDLALGALFRLVGRTERWRDLWLNARDILISEARLRFMREDSPVEVPLSSAGKLQERIAARLCEHPMIAPSAADEFLSLLVAELIGHLSKGGRVEGNWGSIEVCGADLVYRLTA